MGAWVFGRIKHMFEDLDDAALVAGIEAETRAEAAAACRRLAMIAALADRRLGMRVMSGSGGCVMAGMPRPRRWLWRWGWGSGRRRRR